MLKPEFHVFVCTSSRINGQQKGFCHQKEGVGIVEAFIEAVDENDLTDKVMITNTGCFGICSQGPIVVVYPENVWYKEVSVEDVAEIVESHFVNGVSLERLVIE